MEAQLNTIYNENHTLPIAAHVKVSSSLMHFWLNIFEMGMRVDWQPISTGGNKTQPSENPELSAINKQLGIITEEFQKVSPLLAVYLKGFGNEFNEFTINSNDYMSLILTSAMSNTSMQKLFSLGDGALTVSTDIGLPLSLNVSTAASFALMASLRNISLLPQFAIS
ncbi:open beta-sheet domain-containing protein, partial [Salmonella sp. s54395]|uniref:open beta-sheet domain-containing protein n=1 Tax=Salmonella sp. s54395 TaxID=3159664 RepID=UPI0039815158